MKFIQNPGSLPKMLKSWKPLTVLLIGLMITAITAGYTISSIRRTVIREFEHTSAELQGQMNSRLRAHAQLLRSGAALFAVSDTVTRDMWRQFYEHKRLHKYLPGIQGYGYTKIIPPDRLHEHEQSVRQSGFPEYRVFPEGDREIYTSIIYLEPFSERNLRAFGYDMFSEPVRRKAMETARDSSFAVLSGKVFLVQETDEDIQAGALMYIPVYRHGMPTSTVEERRAAITGWVYSPYRINDLTRGILGNWDLAGSGRIRLRIYESAEITAESLLFDSQQDEMNTRESDLSVVLPLQLNSEEWTLIFSRDDQELSLLNRDFLIVLASGVLISFLLFFLALALIRSRRDSLHIMQLNSQLEKLNADKDRFISILGHDLRNPFNSMLGFLNILTKDFHILEKDKAEHYLNHVNTVIKNTYSLLEDLLKWTNAQSGNIPFRPGLVNLRDICLHVHKHLDSAASAKNITVNYLVDTDIRVYADIDMLKLILRNLISNAIKFTNHGGKISIDATEDNGQVMVSVTDNGIGITADNLEKLFHISETITSRGTANETGSGLGLIICREFVEMHGGYIRAESQEGKGSRFIFSLPQVKRGSIAAVRSN